MGLAAGAAPGLPPPCRRCPPLWGTRRALLGVRCRPPALHRRWLFLARHRVSPLGGGRGARPFLSETPEYRPGEGGGGPGLAWPALPVAVACAAAPAAGGRGESVERAYSSVPSKRCGVPVSFEGTSQREEPRRIDPPPAKRDRSIFSTLRGLFVLNKLRTAETCLSCGYLSCVLRRSVPTCFGHGLQFC